MDYRPTDSGTPQRCPHLEAAHRYAKLGFSVFALNGKIPLTPNGHKDATIEFETIRHWWETWPYANIGVRPDGFFVVDEDPRHGGDKTLATFEGEHGKLPETPTQRTGGGGNHYLFNVTPELESLSKFPKEIGAGLDLKFSNGYIVVDPSIHPETGAAYEWIIPLEVGIADPPRWLVDLILSKVRDGHRSKHTSATRIIPIPSESIPDGRRNDALMSLAGSMRRRGMSEDAIGAALQAENTLKCNPPLPEGEVAAIARSVCRYEPESSPPCNPTDYGNAQRLVARFGEGFRFVSDWNCFLVWHGKRWVKDRSGAVERFAKETIKAMYEEASAIPDDEARKASVKWAMRSESKERIKAMVELSKSEPGIPITPEDLDCEGWLLNVENGTLDLRTGQLRGHSRKDLITKLAPVIYDAYAKAPTFRSFLERILPSQALRTFVKRAVGYSLTGDASERAFLILHGSGKNGKSTLLEAIQAMLGDYAMTTPVETLLLKPAGSIPNDIARLKGARFVSASENERGRKLAEALVKAMTGKDTISARFMRGEFFDFRPTHKLWLATNHKPEIAGTDPAIWDRIKLVPFNVRIPEEEQDKHLDEKLEAELSGVLAWAVEGCLEWQREGLTEPDEVRSATESYKEEMDPLARFIEECCVFSPDLRTPAKDLTVAYRIWVRENGEQELPWREVISKLKTHGCESLRTNTERGWIGIGLTEEGEQMAKRAALLF
jgi:putative DNA primase/helicase